MVQQLKQMPATSPARLAILRPSTWLSLVLGWSTEGVIHSKWQQALRSPHTDVQD